MSERGGRVPAPGKGPRGHGPTTPAAAAALGQALDAFSDAFILVDREGLVQAANAEARRMCDAAEGELHGRALTDVLPHGARRPVARALGAAVQGVPQSFDVRLRRGPGWYAAHLHPTGSGAVLHLHDVTARHHVEHALSFLARAGAALATVADEAQLLRVTKRLVVPRLAEWCVLALDCGAMSCRVRAMTGGAVERQQLLELLGGADALGQLRELASPGRRDSDPQLLRRPDAPGRDGKFAEALWTLASSILVVPLSGGEGEQSYMLMGRGEGTRAFRRREVRLAGMLGSRLRLVLEKVRLHEAEQRAIRLRDDVLAIVAHDLRVPLNTIVLGATTIASHPAHDGLRETAQRSVLSAADQMHRLLTDLVDAARLEAGWVPRQHARLEVARLLEESAAEFRWQAERAGVTLAATTDQAGDAAIDVDPGRIGEAIANLLDNALKFTPRGGSVTIAAEWAERGRTVEITVADTGPGIAPEQLPHLFDRFWQARTAGRAGAGLGLFIVRRIVEAHGGRVAAEPRPGGGTTFRLLLPATAVPRAEEVPS